MAMSQVFISSVHQAAQKRILFLPHALDEMNNPEELITTEEVRKVIFYGEIIELYPDDPRGQSCLMLGYGNQNRPIHIVVSPKEAYLAVITTYLPSSGRWSPDWKTRKIR